MGIHPYLKSENESPGLASLSKMSTIRILPFLYAIQRRAKRGQLVRTEGTFIASIPLSAPENTWLAVRANRPDECMLWGKAQTRLASSPGRPNEVSILPVPRMGHYQAAFATGFLTGSILRCQGCKRTFILSILQRRINNSNEIERIIFCTENK